MNIETLEGEYWRRERCSRCDKTGEINLVQSIENFSFEVTSEEKKTCELTGYKRYYYDERDNTIIIPRIWKGYSVTSIRNNAFNNCVSLTSIIVEEGNTVYDSRNNCNAIIETSTNRLIVGCASTIIPDSVSSIGDYAFRGCKFLTAIVIPDSVTYIGDYAFYGCISLTTLVIPDNVTSIGEKAFTNCSSLTDVYYTGTEEQWKAIIGGYSDYFTSATIHYNYTCE